MKTVQLLSKSIVEQKMVDKLDELDELLAEATAELTGIREAFIDYKNAMSQILKEIEDDKQN